MSKKPNYTSFLNSFISTNGVYICIDNGTGVMYKEKNLRKKRIILYLALTALLLLLSVLKGIGIEFRVLLFTLLFSLIASIILIFSRFKFVNFIKIESIEEAENTKISNVEHILTILLWGAMIFFVF